MKHGFWKRALALIMAIVIVMSTGVLGSAGRLLASDGETEPTVSQETAPASQEQGSTVVQETVITTDPTVAPTDSTDPTGEPTDPTGEPTDPTGEPTDPTGEPTDPTGEPTDPTGEPTDPTGEPTDPTGEPTDPTGEPTDPSEEATDPTEESTEPTGEVIPDVILTVVVKAVYADGSQPESVITWSDLVYGPEDSVHTYSTAIPSVEGYTYAISGADMTLNAEGKYEITLPRPDAHTTLNITVTYSPIPVEDPTEPSEEPTEPSEDPTEESTEPSEPAGDVSITVWLNIAYIGATQEPSTVNVGSVTFGEGETQQPFTFAVPQVENHAHMVDSEVFGGNGDGTYTALLPRPEESCDLYVDVFYRAVESLETEDLEGVVPVDTYIFLDADGNEVSTQLIKEDGEAVYAPASPVMDGYKFLGWENQDAPGTYFSGAEAFVGNQTYTYQADFQQIYYVFFMDTQHNRIAVTMEGPQVDTAGVTFSLSSPEQAITGWYLDEALTQPAGVVTLTDANVTVYPKIETGAWVTYVTNGLTNFEPAFVKPGGTAANPGTPVRTGYNFKHWSASENGEAYDFTTTVSAELTLYAVWEAQTVNFTIVYWVENADDDGYTYDSQSQGSAATGSTITLTNTQLNKNNLESVNSTYFTYKEYDTGLITAGDGSTVVNVYFSRNTYTLTFRASNRTVATITDKYDAYIADEFSKAPFSTTYAGRAWSATSTYSYALQTLDRMPGTNVTFNIYNKSSSILKTIHYMVESVDGTGYVELKTVETYFNYMTYAEEFHPIAGFERDRQTSNFTGNSKYFDDNNEAYLYYSRNSYNLIFQNVNTTAKTESVKYQAPLADYFSYTPSRPQGVDPNYVFGGWYTDPTCQAGHEAAAALTTMPIGDVVVYAKWAPPTYTATVYLTMTGVGSTTLTVPYGSTISESDMPAPNVPEGYAFQCWARLVGGEYIPFSFDTKITSNIELYPYYISTDTFTVSYDLNGGTGTVPVDDKVYADTAAADIKAATGVTHPEGLVFLGWSTTAGGSAQYQPGDKIVIDGADVTLYAVWGQVALPATLIYNSNYPSETGKTNTAVRREYANNKSIVLEGSLFSVEGYRFLGWSTSSGDGNSVTHSGTYMVTNNAVNNLYAVWEKMVFTVSYAYTGDVPAGAPAVPAAHDEVYGTQVSVAAAPTLDGYVFSGWSAPNVSASDGAFLMPAANVAFTGSWSKRTDLSYTVHYYLNGTTEEAAPSKTVSGQTFQASVTEEAISIDGYTLASDASSTITIQSSGNVIIFYYYKNVTLTANSDTRVYSGYAQSVSGFTASESGANFLTSGITAGATGTAAGEYPATFAADPVGTVDVSGKYLVTEAVDGLLTITPVDTITVTITGNSATRTYNGSVQAVEGYTTDVTDATITVTLAPGSTARAEGTNVGGYPMGLTADDFVVTSPNFTNIEVVVVDGGLTIVPVYSQIIVTITGNSATKVYTGSEQSVTGFTTDITDSTITAQLAAGSKAEATGTNVGEYPMGLKASDFVVTSPNYANIKVVVVDGKLTITPVTDEITVTITGNSATKVYTGSEQSVTGFTTDITDSTITAQLAPGSKAEATGTNVGEYPMGLEAADFTVTSPNYANIKVVVVDGKLTITSASFQVTFTGESGSVMYTGSEQSVTGITAQGLLPGHTYESLSYVASGTDVGSYTGVFTGDVRILDNGVDVTENYSITRIPGKLDITAYEAEITVTITENSGTYLYDGAEKEVTGYTVSISNPLYTEADFAFRGNAAVTGTDAGSYDMELSPQDFVNESPNFANVTFVIVDGTLEIEKRQVFLTSATDSKAYDGEALTNDEVTVTGDGFADGEGASFDVTGSQLNLGVSNNTFTYTLNAGTKAANYDISTVEGTLTVTALTETVTVTITENSGTYLYDGTGKQVEGYTVSISNQLYSEDDFLFYGIDTVTGTDAGSYDMALKSSDFVNTNTNFSSVTFVIVDGTLEIEKRQVILTSATDSKVYDGKALTNEEVTVSGDGFAANEGFTAYVTGSQTQQGSSANTFTYKLSDGTKASNYDISTVEGTLTVTALTDTVTVTITENSGEYLYDSLEKTVTGYTVSIDNDLYTASDFAFQGDATVSGLDAGSYAMEITPEDFVNQSANFANVTFVIVDGTLEISKRQVTLTSADDTKVYDGTALTNDTVTVTGDGFVYGEGYTATVTGSQTDVGSSTNAFTYSLKDGTKASNYDISTVEGTLTVTPVTAAVTVTITENSGTYLYDGAEKEVTGYTVSISNPLYTAADFAFRGDAAVTGLDAGSYDMELSPQDFVNESSNFANVTFVIVDGTLEIEKRQVTLTSADDAKVYDGTALTNDTVTVTGDGFATGEGAAYDVTGSQLNLGVSDNTFTYTLNAGTKAQNYDITVVPGKLTITALQETVTVTITENAGSYVYDGAEKIVTGYTVSIDNPLYTGADFAFYGIDTVTGTNAGSYDMALKASDFQNISTNFANVTFVIVDGTLEITRRPVTLTSADAQKEYDGTALTAEEVTVTEGSFVDGQGVELYYDFASQTLVGTADNTFSYKLSSGTRAANYDITVVNGTLEVTDRSEKFTVTLTANSGERVYNGQPFTVEGYAAESADGTAASTGADTAVTVTIDGVAFTVSGVGASRTETDVLSAAPAALYEEPYGSYMVWLDGTAVITDAQGNDVTAQFAVESVDGELTITPKAVTMVSADDTKAYDGTGLTNDTVTVEGFVDGEGATFDVTGTQTLIGSSENEFTFTLNDNTKAQNYSIETTFGTLTVTPPEDFEILEKTHETEGTYKLGDTVTFTITVENIFDAEATVTVTEQEGVSILWNGGKVSSVETTIAAGETLTLQAEYVIQEQDLVNGSFTNTVTADIKATVKEIPYEGKDDDDDTVVDIEEPKAVLTLDKVTTSTPADGDKYVSGETIVYTITATNNGNLTLHDIVITDTMTGIARGAGVVKTFTIPGPLAPGESETFTYEHTVVEEDLGKTLYNAVTAEAKNTSEDDDDKTNDVPTEVADDEVSDETEDIRRELQISKTLLNPQEVHALQSKLYYEIVVTNAGNVTEHNVIVTDQLLNAYGADQYFRFTDLAGGQLLSGNRVLLTSLAPGASVTIRCEYHIVAGDMGKIIGNKATVHSDELPDPVEDDAETAQVQMLYALYIKYVEDETWQEVAPTHYSLRAEGDHYYEESPEVAGYTTTMTVATGTMPGEETWIYVVYSKLPQEPTEPSETTEPTEPSETTEPTEPTYDLTEIPDDEVPLGNVEVDLHTCCIMHFLIMLVAMVVLAFYCSDRKKLQKRFFDLRRALAAEDNAK